MPGFRNTSTYLGGNLPHTIFTHDKHLKLNLILGFIFRDSIYFENKLAYFLENIQRYCFKANCLFATRWASTGPLCSVAIIPAAATALSSFILSFALSVD